MSDPRTILTTDCGSTTTKAILIEKAPDRYRLRVRGEAPTTVEAPFDDVTVGVLNAVGEVEELTGRRIIEGGRILRPQEGGRGVDLYISTSSAGGGLQMMVTGVVRTMTAESAERAALGAGAIVMDVIASNDRRLPHQQIERIRRLRPDMILLSGGVDGGTTTHVAELAELIAAADPRPRLGIGYRLPVVYAGNRDARDAVRATLGDRTDLEITENLRPRLEVENLGPARERIHELFMEHVMAQAPGYDRLREWCDAPIMPTPGAVGALIQAVAREQGIAVLGVDIGGATTDIFSVFGGVFNRTVSANLGMSYSISNVLSSAGIDAVLRRVPFRIGEADLRNRVKNKMIRPTTIPQTLEELRLEQAIAREALRLAFAQHRAFATTLKGVQRRRTIAEAFEQTRSGETIVDMLALRLIIGSGGVLSHAPDRRQAASMLIDGFQPEGVTELAVDSIFMMPHLGVLSTIEERAATEVFREDCLVPLGTVIAPRGRARPGREALRIRIEGHEALPVAAGELRRVELGTGERVRFEATPARGWDLGAGSGKRIEGEATGGAAGIVLDGRGRPLELPAREADRLEALRRWAHALGLEAAAAGEG